MSKARMVSLELFAARFALEKVYASGAVVRKLTKNSTISRKLRESNGQLEQN